MAFILKWLYKANKVIVDFTDACEGEGNLIVTCDNAITAWNNHTFNVLQCMGHNDESGVWHAQVYVYNHVSWIGWVSEW